MPIKFLLYSDYREITILKFFYWNFNQASTTDGPLFCSSDLEVRHFYINSTFRENVDVVVLKEDIPLN